MSEARARFSRDDDGQIVARRDTGQRSVTFRLVQGGRAGRPEPAAGRPVPPVAPACAPAAVRVELVVCGHPAGAPAPSDVEHGPLPCVLALATGDGGAQLPSCGVIDGLDVDETARALLDDLGVRYASIDQFDADYRDGEVRFLVAAGLTDDDVALPRGLRWLPLHRLPELPCEQEQAVWRFLAVAFDDPGEGTAS